MMTESLNLEPEFTDLAWEDEVYDEEEYPYVMEESEFEGYYLGTWLGDGECE